MLVQLYEYQTVAKMFLLQTQKAILADDIGVGKTFPAIAALLEAPRPRLLITPAYLQLNWKLELERFHPGLSIARIDGSVDVQKKFQVLRQPSTYDIVMTSYSIVGMSDPKQPKKNPQSLGKPLYPFQKTTWGAIACDEAHNLRGRNSNATQFLYRIPTKYLFLLTGTPIMNNGGDLYPLLHLCNPTEFSSYWRFVEEWCVVRQGAFDREVGAIIHPERLSKQVLGRYMLRRRHSDIGSNIPDTTTQVVHVEPTGTTRTALGIIKRELVKLIETAEGDWTKIPLTSASAVLHELRRATAKDEEKLRTLIAILNDLPMEKAIVWCWYKDTVDIVAARLRKRWPKRNVVVVTGDVAATKRLEMANAFNESEDDILVATLASLSTGANLQKSRISIFYERDHLPATNDQALGRQVRIGQQETVLAYTILAYRTVDESIHRVEGRRRQNIDEVMSNVVKDILLEVVERT